jgi:hypothetical protein
MEACLATPPRGKRVWELLEGDRDSEVVELSMLAKEEGLSEATPPETRPPGTRNFVEKKGWFEGGRLSPDSPGSYTTYSERCVVSTYYKTC